MNRLVPTTLVLLLAGLVALPLVAQDDGKARQLLDEVVGELKARREKREAESMELTRDAIGFYAERKFFEARKLLKRALEADPTNPRAQKYFKLATKALQDEHDPRLDFARQRELSRFEQARERTMLEIKLQRAEALVRDGQFRKAETLLREVRNEVAWSFHRNDLQDLSDQADAAFKRLVAAEAEDAPVDLPAPEAARNDDLKARQAADKLVGTAETLYQDGQLERAEAYVTVALKIDPGNVRARRFLSSLASGRDLRLHSMVLPEHDVRTTASGADVLRRRDDKVLIQPVRAEFNRATLKDALEYLEAYCDVDIVVDSRDLARVGATLKSPVTLEVDGQRLGNVMRMIGEQVKLEPDFKNGVIVLKAPDGAGETVTRVYDVSDLLAPEPQERDPLLEALPNIPLAGAILDPVGFPNVYLSGTSQFYLHNYSLGYAPYGSGFAAGIPGYGTFWGPGAPFTGWGGYPYGGGVWIDAGWTGSVPTGPGPYYPWPDRSYSLGGGYGGTYYGSRYGGFPGFSHRGTPGFGWPPYAGSNEAAGPLWGLSDRTIGGPGWFGTTGGVYEPMQSTDPKIFFDLDDEASARQRGVQPTTRRRRDPHGGGWTEEQLLGIVREALENSGYEVT